ncbi:hypothetical protein Calkro_0635 [Caldicellulosiruptor kronotskyensis 2002]|uniref:PrgI family protein n=2 Tax=Caldicellulosiruptor TaxID=44000 RepID=E4SEP2_CALK2|nr:hypothetical protein Calkro_0635 [Caldicellulosiruptor kronotskyensis 2002]
MASGQTWNDIKIQGCPKTGQPSLLLFRISLERGKGMRTFQVPFEREFEDKIFFGVLTLRQFVIIAIFIATPVVLALFARSLILFVTLVPVSMVLGLAIAFVKIKGDTLTKYFRRIISFYTAQRTFLYRRRK